jgi:hypothetical protein
MTRGNLGEADFVSASLRFADTNFNTSPKTSVDNNVGVRMKLSRSFVRLCTLLIVLAVTCGVVSVATAQVAATKEADTEIINRLKQATQELLDAIAPGNKAVWEHYMAAGSIYADEEGRVLTKDELIKELNPIPQGYVGSIKIEETKSLVQAGVVVLSHRDREELQLYGQKIVTYFHMTNTWAKQADGKWQLVSTHVMAIPNERKPATVDPKTLNDYVGEYQLAPQMTYTITRDGDKLFGQRTGRAKEELLPLCADMLYRKGTWRGEKVFNRDTRGRVIAMLDRRENNDLVWQKVK